MNIKKTNYNNALFRKNLNYLIEKRGITKKFLEKELKLGEGSLSRYCSNNYKAPIPSIELINNLATNLDVQIDSLVNEDIDLITRMETRKEFKLFNKLIEDTKSNLLNWEICNIESSYFEEYYESIVYRFDDILSKSDDNDVQYHSKFLNETYDLDKVIWSFMANITSNTSVLILKLFIDQKYEDNCYELYFVKEEPNQNEVLPVIASHRSELFSSNIEFDEDSYSILSIVYETVKHYVFSGKDRFKIKDIIDEYLDEVPV